MTSDRTWATYPQAASARAWKPDAADPDPAGQGTRRQLRGELFDGMAATGVTPALLLTRRSSEAGGEQAQAASTPPPARAGATTAQAEADPALPR